MLVYVRVMLIDFQQVVFVPFSNWNKQTFSFPLNRVSLLGFSVFFFSSPTSEVNLLGDSFIQLEGTVRH